MLAMTSKVSTFATRSKLSAQGVDRCVLLGDCHGVDTDEALDDNIFVALEELNKASVSINSLEVELDAARISFQQVLNDSSSQLDVLLKKLGSCVDKARPYYDARIKAKEVQIRTHEAAHRYELSCGQLEAAKEMVNLAEQGYFKQGQQFDPAWQEMLNHSTVKVNEAERERFERALEHKLTAQASYDAEQLVKKLARDLKRIIAKSQPYFELKAQVNNLMEVQKKKVTELEEKLRQAKSFYSATLHSLESISDEIHARRRECRLVNLRQARNSDGTLIYHPLMSSTELLAQEDIIVENKQIKQVDYRRSASSSLTSDVISTDVSDIQRILPHCLSVSSVSPSHIVEHQILTNEKSQPSNEDVSLLKNKASKSTNNNYPVRNVSADSLLVYATSTKIDINAPQENVIETEPISMTAFHDNLPSSGSLCKQSLSLCPGLLRPNAYKEDCDCGGSETESVASSFTSTAVLDDEQIESLMMETGEYQRFLNTLDSHSSAEFRQMSLPAKLSYLKDYVIFEPMWVTDDVEYEYSKESPDDNLKSAPMNEENLLCFENKHSIFDDKFSSDSGTCYSSAGNTGIPTTEFVGSSISDEHVSAISEPLHRVMPSMTPKPNDIHD